jgi:2-methylisocitrate lyase-like PEP mutase family enzyme
MPTQAEKGAAFRALHEGAPFVIPNPWDAGSARVLEALGFTALASTSSGFAFTLGRVDGGVTLDEVAAHTRALNDATSLPVAIDLEYGFGARPEDAVRAIARIAEAGAVGASIEDWDPAGRVYDIGHATERVAAATEAARALDFPFMLCGRAENYVHGINDIDDTIARLQAYEKAGADVLFAPRLLTDDEVRAVCGAVTKPVNVLARPDMTVAGIFEAGAQRISVGGNLTWSAMHAMIATATMIRDEGSFDLLEFRPPPNEWLS